MFVMQVDFAFVDADAIEEGTLAAVVGRRKLESEESIIEEKVNYITNEINFNTRKIFN